MMDPVVEARCRAANGAVERARRALSSSTGLVEALRELQAALASMPDRPASDEERTLRDELYRLLRLVDWRLVEPEWRAAAGGVAMLRYPDDAGGTQTVELHTLGRAIVVGRSVDAGVSLARKDVHREHLRIEVSQGAIWLKNLGHMDTKVNGSPIDDAPVRLVGGEDIEIGGAHLLFQVTSAKAGDD
ncbi:MAG TPA: FHA domain-containing protein [Myxococcota bacterium]|jgi:hypothetical protein|nr:FHA domain-containing protein [Myxococcota bacterium]